MSVKRTIDTCRRRERTSDASLFRTISIIYSPCRSPLFRLLQAKPLSPQHGLAKNASPPSILKTCSLSLFGPRIPCEESRVLRRSRSLALLKCLIDYTSKSRGVWAGEFVGWYDIGHDGIYSTKQLFCSVPESSTQCSHDQESLPIAPGSRDYRPLASSIRRCVQQHNQQ